MIGYTPKEAARVRGRLASDFYAVKRHARSMVESVPDNSESVESGLEELRAVYRRLLDTVERRTNDSDR